MHVPHAPSASLQNAFARTGLERYTGAAFMERSAAFLTSRATGTAVFVGMGYAYPYFQALLSMESPAKSSNRRSR